MSKRTLKKASISGSIAHVVYSEDGKVKVERIIAKSIDDAIKKVIGDTAVKPVNVPTPPPVKPADTPVVTVEPQMDKRKVKAALIKLLKDAGVNNMQTCTYDQVKAKYDDIKAQGKVE